MKGLHAAVESGEVRPHRADRDQSHHAVRRVRVDEVAEVLVVHQVFSHEPEPLVLVDGDVLEQVPLGDDEGDRTVDAQQQRPAVDRRGEREGEQRNGSDGDRRRSRPAGGGAQSNRGDSVRVRFISKK